MSRVLFSPSCNPSCNFSGQIITTKRVPEVTLNGGEKYGNPTQKSPKDHSSYSELPGTLNTTILKWMFGDFQPFFHGNDLESSSNWLKQPSVKLFVWRSRYMLICPDFWVQQCLCKENSSSDSFMSPGQTPCVHDLISNNILLMATRNPAFTNQGW